MIKKIIGIFFCFMIISCSTNIALQNSEGWIKYYGVLNDASGSSVKETSDGGYVIVGRIRPFENSFNSDVFLIKTDDDGNIEWEKTFGGSNSDGGGDIQLTNDGGYIIAGFTRSFGNPEDSDIWLIKTDVNGNEMWNKTYGNDVKNESGWSVKQTNDGGFIVSGSSSSGLLNYSAYLIKTDINGNLEWYKYFYEGYGRAYGRDVQQTNDGGYVLTGSGYFDGSSSAFLIKMDGDGNVEWEKTYGDLRGPVDAWEVKQTNDGGYIIVGSGPNKIIPWQDVKLIKTDYYGKKKWDRNFGYGFIINAEYGRSVEQTNDGGYIITGSVHLPQEDDVDVWLIKTDSTGNRRWARTYGGNEREFGYEVHQTSDGGYIVVGYSEDDLGNSDVLLIKVDKTESISKSIFQNII